MFITVAPTGAETTKQQSPTIPLQPEEIINEAVACRAAGAAMIHIHGRDSKGRSTLDLKILEDIVAGVKASTDLVVQLSTGGSVRDSFEERLRVVELNPESCSLTCGTVNFGDEVFHNPYPFIRELYQETQTRGIVPEFELFDFGHIDTLKRLLREEGKPATGIVHCNLVMGVPGGMPGDASTLVAAQSMLPKGASWSVTGIGRSHLGVIFAALALDGNLRVGMEDVLRFSATELVRDNKQLVDRAVELSTIAQKELDTPSELRKKFGLVQS